MKVSNNPIVLEEIKSSRRLIGSMVLSGFVALLFLGTDIYGFLTMEREAFTNLSLEIIALVATVSNVFVIIYHGQVPPHPKFTMLLRRRICMIIHMTAGTIEITASVAGYIRCAYFGEDQIPWGYIQATAAFLHTISAIYQTPIVFGAKAIMMSSYYFVEGLHILYAIRSILSPFNGTSILQTYMVLNIFTFCRLYIGALNRYNIARTKEYSLSIFMAGLTVAPFLMGPLSIFCMAGGLCLFLELFRLFGGISFDDPEFLENIEERCTYATGIDFLNEDRDDLWLCGDEGGVGDIGSTSAVNNVLKAEAEAIKEEAREIFHFFDKSGTGCLDSVSLTEMVKAYHVPEHLVHILLTKLKNTSGNKIDFNTFYELLVHVPRCMRPAKATTSYKTDEQRAKLVFETLDVNNKGYLEASSLSRLLVMWGCPPSEAVEYLQVYDNEKKGKLEFVDFFTKMKPIWKYVFQYYEREAALDLKLEGAFIKSQTNRRSFFKPVASESVQYLLMGRKVTRGASAAYEGGVRNNRAASRKATRLKYLQSINKTRQSPVEGSTVVHVEGANVEEI